MTASRSTVATSSLATLRGRVRENFGAGGVFTWFVSNQIASWISVVALRLNVHPTVASLANPVAALIGSTALIASTSSPHSWWQAGWYAAICWPLAYTFDCVDGQVARVAGKTSEYGARVDVLADYMAHVIVVVGITSLVAKVNSEVPTAAVTAISGLWVFGTLAALLRKDDSSEGHSLFGGGVVSFTLRSVLDTGFVTAIFGVCVLVTPALTIWLLFFYGLLYATFVVATLARESKQSFRARSGS